MKLIVIYGPPAAGKLTVAARLQQKTGYKLIHNHQIFDLIEPLFGVYHPAFSPLLYRLRTEIAREAAHHHLPGLIFTLVYGASEKDYINRLEQVVRDVGGEVCFVRLLPDRKALDIRVTQPDRHLYRKIRNPEELSAHFSLSGWEADQEITSTKSYTIDNTKLSADEAADLIITSCRITTS